jgi:probable H4MPT-linked C1 transfer pathway protein
MLGLDIGGANLKASDGAELSRSVPFAIWKHPDRLRAAIEDALQPWPRWQALAVTMTAELADCFATKAEGVGRILDAVEEVAAGRPAGVWQTGGEFVTPEEARELPQLVAAANWHALATWAGRMTGGRPGLLIDIGSTTTDVIPLVDGLPAAVGAADLERLQSGELVYAGVRRTPLCALAHAVKFNGRDCPLAAELFATTLDLFLLTGELPEDEDNVDTADGRPSTRRAAHQRLAHLLCCDATEVSYDQAARIAGELRVRLSRLLESAVSAVVARLPSPCESLLLCGEGEFLARQVTGDMPVLKRADSVSLTSALGPDHSMAACAYALARLGRERL